MNKITRRRLIVSFVGKTDVKYIEPSDGNMSPVLRLLRGLVDIRPAISASDTELILFDDGGKDEERELFFEILKNRLPENGLEGLKISRIPVNISRPTDLDAIYDEVWKHLDSLRSGEFSEAIFHASSGTFAMQITLVLAATCRPFRNTRIFQTSKYNDGSLQELQLPYDLAAKDVRRNSRVAQHQKLSPTARRSLLKNTVVEDSSVEAAYQALYKAAKSKRNSARIAILGPTGCGKWHACQQFAEWRGKPVVTIQTGSPTGSINDIPRDATVLLKRIDCWSSEKLNWLFRLSDERSDTAIAASFRVDNPFTAKDSLLNTGLNEFIELPALGARNDQVQLAKSLALKNGIHAGKLEGRLKYELFTGTFPHGLHDLETRLCTASLFGGGEHIDQRSFQRVSSNQRAAAILDEAFRILTGLEFRSGVGLNEIIEDIKLAVVLLAIGKTGSQPKAETLIGISQSAISRIKSAESNGFHLDKKNPEE